MPEESSITPEIYVTAQLIVGTCSGSYRNTRSLTEIMHDQVILAEKVISQVSTYLEDNSIKSELSDKTLSSMTTVRGLLTQNFYSKLKVLIETNEILTSRLQHLKSKIDIEYYGAENLSYTAKIVQYVEDGEQQKIINEIVGLFKEFSYKADEFIKTSDLLEDELKVLYKISKESSSGGHVYVTQFYNNLNALEQYTRASFTPAYLEWYRQSSETYGSMLK